MAQKLETVIGQLCQVALESNLIDPRRECWAAFLAKSLNNNAVEKLLLKTGVAYGSITAQRSFVKEVIGARPELTHEINQGDLTVDIPSFLRLLASAVEERYLPDESMDVGIAY